MKRIAILVAAVLAVVLVGTVGGRFTRRDAATGDRDGATWELLPGEQVTAATTTLTVRVSPTECTSGRVDDLQGPGVRVEDDRMVVTYTVAALRTPPGEAENCMAHYVVRTLTLPEPLGHRMLVDGTCPAYEPAGNPRCVRVPAP